MGGSGWAGGCFHIFPFPRCRLILCCKLDRIMILHYLSRVFTLFHYKTKYKTFIFHHNYSRQMIFRGTLRKILPLKTWAFAAQNEALQGAMKALSSAGLQIGFTNHPRQDLCHQVGQGHPNQAIFGSRDWQIWYLVRNRWQVQGTRFKKSYQSTAR